MPKLLVEKGPLKGQSLVLASASALVIGREPSCSLVIGDTNISRKHCEFAMKGAGWVVKDLGSRNGTYVNGKRIGSEVKLSVGDRLQVGETLLSFLDESEGKDAGGLIGQRIGGYRILERLGRGGMGTVYKANQIALNREVALKVLSPDLIKEDLFKNLFIKEARAAAALNHPNIVQVHDVGVEGGLYFFSMEFMPNGSVHDLLTREGRVSPARALRMAMDAAAGLSYADRKGIVHRDIKPENLMVSEGGAIKIGDLGLAFNVETESDLDDEVGVMGTPHYCAPEQVTRGKLDHRTDLYALGATMYRMMAGRPPFTGQTLKEILVKKVREKPAALKEAVPALPESVGDLVMQLLEREPARRPTSAEEVRGRIEAILPEVEGIGSSTSRGGSTTSVGSSAGVTLPASSGTNVSVAAPRGAGAGLVLGAAGVLLAAGIGAWAWTQHRKVRSAGNGAGPVVPQPPKDGNGGTGQTPSASELANKLLDEAVKFRESNEAALRTREGLNAAIRKFDEVGEKYDGTSAATLARREAKALRDRLQNMLANEALARAVAAADAADENFQGTLDPRHLEEAVPALRAVAEQYPGTEAAVGAAARVEELQRRIESVAKAAEAWTATRDRVAGLARTRRFADALAALREYATTFEGSGWDQKADEELATTEKLARADFDRLLQVDLKPLLDSKSWEPALRLLGESRGLYGLADLEERLLEQGEEIRAAAAKVDRPPDVPDDAQILATALAAAAEMEHAWKFAAAVKALREAADRVKDEKARTRLLDERDDCELMEIFRLALRAHANGNDRDESGLKSREFRKTHILGATDGGLQLEAGGELAWGDIAPDEAFRIGTSAWTMSGRECLGVGIIALRAGYYRCARYVFSAARFRDPNLSAAAKALTDRAAREEFARSPTQPLAARLFEKEILEMRAAQAAADKILPALGKDKDPRGQGEVYSGIQDFEQSQKYFELALKEQAGLTGDDEWRIHWFMMVNAIMLGDDTGRARHRFQAADRFPQPESMKFIYELDTMYKGLVPALLRIDELRMAMRSRPDTAVATELLKLTAGGTHLLVETRVVARWLVEVDGIKKGEYVKSGEPQRILAQACLDQKDYVEASRMLERLRKNYPTHDWCRTPENGQRKVDKEALRCSALIRQYSLTSPPR